MQELKPYQYIKNKKPVGINIDLLETIAKQQEITFEFRFETKERIYDLIKDSLIDAVLFPNYIELPTELFFNNPRPISQSNIVIFARDNYDRELKLLSDLRGQTVGVLEGYIYGTEFDNYLQVNRHYSEDLETSIRLFANNRYQLFISEQLIGKTMLEESGMSYYKIMPFIANSFAFTLNILKEKELSMQLLDIIEKYFEKTSEIEVSEETVPFIE